MVNWKHNSRGGAALPMGFYIQLQEQTGRGGRLGAPDFVRVKNGTLEASVYGLKPEANYALKVDPENDSTRTEGIELSKCGGF